MALYTRFDKSICQFQVFAMRAEDFSVLSHQEALVNARGPLNGGDGVETTALDRLANVNNTLRYVTYLIFFRLHLLIVKYKPYLEAQERSALLKYVLESDLLSRVFQHLLNSVVVLLSDTGLSILRPSVI